MQLPPTMNTEECAALLKIHPITLTKLAKAGGLPAYKAGKSWVFPTELVMKWLEQKALAGCSNYVNKGGRPRKVQ